MGRFLVCYMADNAVFVDAKADYKEITMYNKVQFIEEKYCASKKQEKEYTKKCFIKHRTNG